MNTQDFLWLQENTGFQDSFECEKEARENLQTVLAFDAKYNTRTAIRQLRDRFDVSHGTSNENS